MRRLIVAAAILYSVTALAVGGGTDIPVEGTLETNGKTYPIARDTSMYGGYRVVADDSARDAIAALRRSDGMLVRVRSSAGNGNAATDYRLGSDLTTWTIITYGVTAHSALTGLTSGDDHTQYQLRSEKNAASGYAGLSAGSLLTGSQIPYGVIANTAVQGNDVRVPPDVSGNSGKFLYTNGSTESWVQPTLDQILPAFAITGFSGTGIATKELGDTIVSPAFTLSYNRTASHSVISDNAGNASLTLTGPFTSGTMAFTYSKTTPNASVSWTDTADEGGPSKTASTSATWQTRTWYGIATPGTLNSAFITGLASTQLAAGYGGTFSIGAGSNTKKAYYCIDSAFGTPNSFKDGGGFAVPMTAQSGVSVTNAFSVARTIVCYQSDNFLNSALSLVVN